MQNNPIRLRSNTADAYGRELGNIGKEFENQGAARKERISSATEGLQLDAAQKKLIQEASEADIKNMKNLFQRMTYSANPEEQKRGLAGLQLSEEFVKIRAQGDETRKTAAQQQQHAKDLERFKQDQITSRDQAKLAAKAKGETTAGDIWKSLMSGKIKPDAAVIALMAAAQQEPDENARAVLIDAANQARTFWLSGRPDPTAGKLDDPNLSIKDRPNVPIRTPGGNPGNPRSNQAQLPAGAKQIGTSGGKPVYEINGKKFILE
jgi:hypothetical protein